MMPRLKFIHLAVVAALLPGSYGIACSCSINQKIVKINVLQCH